MPFTLQCPNPVCGRLSSCPDERRGRRVRCRQCGQSFVAAPTTAGAGDTPGAGRPARAPDPPAHVGRFQVRARLGAGAFGTVYRAYDPQLDREVALKVPNPGVLDNPRRVERFLREAQAAANLRHPHIVPVFDAGQDSGLYFIASAFVAGRKLTDTIGDDGTDFARAARLTRELAEALAYAHDQGVVHRDVKPDNVLVDEQDRVHLMDFGLAARQDEESRLTTDGSVLGTPGYMAPEQAAGQKGEARPAADQYSAGVVLYELLCGRVPFAGPPAVVLHNQIHTPPDRPAAVRPGVPRDLETVCLKAMAKAPGDRYPDCADLADDLRRFLAGEPVAARRLGPAGLAWRWARRNPVPAALGSLVAVLLLAVTVGSVWASARLAREKSQTQSALTLAQTEGARAETKAAEATANLGLANTRADELDRQLYRNRVALADRYWRVNSIDRAREALAACTPERRGLEWYYLYRQCHGELLTLAGHTGRVRALAFSPDGKRVASAGDDKTVRVWDLAAAREALRLDADASAVGFSPDGRFLAANGAEDRQVTVWDARTGRVGLRVTGSVDARNGPMFRPGANSLAVMNGPGLALWDVATGKAVRSFAGHADNIWVATFSPDGKRLAARSGPPGDAPTPAARILVWDADTGAVVFNDGGTNIDVPTLVLSADGQRLALLVHGLKRQPTGFTEVGGGEVQVYDLATGKRTLTFAGPPGISDGWFSPDGDRFVGVPDMFAETGRVWDVPSGQPLGSANVGGRLYAADQSSGRVPFSPDGTRVLGGKSLALWDAASGRKVRTLPGGTGPAAFSPDGRRMVTSGEDHVVALWDATRDNRFVEVAGNSNTRAAFLPDGKRVVTRESTVAEAYTVWGATTGRKAFTLEVPGDPIPDAQANALRVGADGRHLFTATGGWTKKDPRCRFFAWDVEARRVARSVVIRPEEGIDGIVISPDGTRVALVTSPTTASLAGAIEWTSKGTPKELSVWDTTTGKRVCVPVRGAQAVPEVAFDPDGGLLAVVDSDVRVLDPVTGEVRRTFPGIGKDGTFISDGRRVATAEGRSVRIRDARSGDDVITLTGARPPVAYSADETRLIAGGEEGGMKVLDAGTGEELLVLTGDGEAESVVAVGPDGFRLMSRLLNGFRVRTVSPVAPAVGPAPSGPPQ